MQSTVGASLQGQTVSLANALRSSLVQSLAWVPVTLAVIYLTVRFPITRRSWRRRVPIHFAAALTMAFVANLLVVLGFWFVSGRFNGWEALLRGAAMWATIRLHVAFLIYVAIATLTQGVVYYRDTRQRELQLARVEGQLAKAQLHTLNAQIRPHFLFNTLHTIGQLWRSGQRNDADLVLDLLGSIFHKVQRHISQTEVPLAEELELVRDYLMIEQVRFRDRLRISISAPPDVEDLLVPPLLLQPLVENAVRHGISRVSKSGQIHVTAERQGAQLVLMVIDDGAGFDGDNPQPGSGTGLSNTRERLRQLYGSAGVLDIVRSEGNTIARIRIPVHVG